MSGPRLGSAAATVVCPQCASSVDSAEEFCPVCGDFLGWREEPAAAVVDLDAPAPAQTADPAPAPPAPEQDPLERFRQAAAAAERRAEEAQREASTAQVRLERVRRRSASARHRVERLEAELPGTEQRARDAEQAFVRAAAGARRAGSAASAAETRAVGDLPVAPERRKELRQRAREATRAEQRARAASLQAVESAATLSGVLQGARAETSTAPAEVGAAQRARDEARAAATAAVRAAAAAAAELALQDKLLRLRATPRRVVGLPAAEERALREQAEREAEQGAQVAVERAEVAERRQRRRAEREDERRSRAEQQADDRELGEVREGAGEAERAASTAERAARPRRRRRTVDVGSWDDVAPDAAADVPRDATAVLPAAGAADTAAVAAPDQVDDQVDDEDDDEPGAVSPVEVRRRVRRRAVPLVPPDDGPLPCPACGAGNAEGRHLCRSCGALLRPGDPEPPAPRSVWWRRLLRLGPRPARPFVPAGARPVPGGNRDTAAAVRRARVGAGALNDGDALRVALPLLALVTALVLLGIGLLTPLGGRLVDLLTGGSAGVRERVGLVDAPVTVLNTRASSTGRKSSPSFAADADPLTSWIAGRAPGSGERLGLTLLAPADLVAIRVTAAPGAGRPRPASITVHSLGRPPVVLRLADTLEPQRLRLSLRGVRDVRVRLDDLYPGAVTGLAAGFAEVELVERRSRPLREAVGR